MTVISISLTDTNVQDLDDLQKTLGLTGRSEAIRACLRSAVGEMHERDSLEGEVEGVMIIIHRPNEGHELDKARHEFQEIIMTQVHSHLRNGKCLDLFLIRGVAASVRSMLSTFQKEEGLDYVKFVQS